MFEWFVLGIIFGIAIGLVGALRMHIAETQAKYRK